jgi:hypothetical protein
VLARLGADKFGARKVDSSLHFHDSRCDLGDLSGDINQLIDIIDGVNNTLEFSELVI